MVLRLSLWKCLRAEFDKKKYYRDEKLYGINVECPKQKNWAKTELYDLD